MTEAALTTSIEKDPKVDRKAPDEFHLQTIIFKKEDGWTKDKAESWIDEKKDEWDMPVYKDGYHETDTEHRFRQYDPEKNKFQYWHKQVDETDVGPVYAVAGAPDDDDDDDQQKSDQ